MNIPLKSNGNLVFLLSVSAFIGFAAFSLVLFKMDPPFDDASVLGIIFFYLSLFIALISFLSLFIYGLRFLTLGKEIGSKSLSPSIRQGILLSVLCIALLLLQSFQLLSLISGFLAVFIIILVEYYFNTGK